MGFEKEFRKNKIGTKQNKKNFNLQAQEKKKNHKKQYLKKKLKDHKVLMHKPKTQNKFNNKMGLNFYFYFWVEKKNRKEVLMFNGCGGAT